MSNRNPRHLAVRDWRTLTQPRRWQFCASQSGPYRASGALAHASLARGSALRRLGPRLSFALAYGFACWALMQGIIRP